jgi:hypothetical protein
MAKNSTSESGFSEEVTAIITGIDQEFSSVRFFPNPANDFLLIRNNSNIELNVIITNSIGVEVLLKNVQPAFEPEIDLRNLCPGVYMVSLIQADGKQTSRLLITR